MEEDLNMIKENKESLNYLLERIIKEPKKYAMYYKGKLIKNIQGYEPQIKIISKTETITDTIDKFSIELVEE